MFGDRNLYHPLVLSAKLQAKSSTAPVYFYEFAYSGNNNIANTVFPDIQAPGLYYFPN